MFKVAVGGLCKDQEHELFFPRAEIWYVDFYLEGAFKGLRGLDMIWLLLPLSSQNPVLIVLRR